MQCLKELLFLFEILAIFSKATLASDDLFDEDINRLLNFLPNEKRGDGPGFNEVPGTYPFTSIEQNEILAKHNELRGNSDPPASFMLKVGWNTALEASAKEHVEKCHWEHTAALGGQGESLWMGPNDDLVNRQNEGPNAVQSWYNEEGFYNYDTNSCQAGKVCGHYFQVVFAPVTSVGCARKFCETVTRPGSSDVKRYWLINCRYSDSFIVGARPFIKGTRCGSVRQPKAGGSMANFAAIAL
ncbi:uncharacterized protein [Amphiura filiformis]|uniref:uncharacterized protein n=1 Tax=Amphiura filiformis TaxID=82378 RepID=UPI003B21B43B